MVEKELEILEKNEAGEVTATYIQSSLAEPKGSSRVDIVLPKRTDYGWRSLLSVFLPAGYPHSVTKDYLDQGVGVGDASASPTAALLLSVLQESMGRIATILFAHKLGTSLEPECKMYRLAADVFNDTAMILDCLSPAFPKVFRVLLLSFSSILRALCGVAAGSSKASLSAHFAKWGNLGELNAKDSSQETIISLLGMLVGSLVVSHITTPFTTWTSLILLLSIHLATNHAAVRAVSMHTLNRQRANIVFTTLFEKDIILTPEEVSTQERIFEYDGVLRSYSGEIIGKFQIGVELKILLSILGGETHEQTGAIRSLGLDLTRLFKIFQHEEYILSYDHQHRKVIIVLKEGVSAISQLKAWAQAILIVTETRKSANDAMEVENRLISTLKFISGRFDDWIRQLREVGWDVDVASLETISGRRILM
ncbi:MAG: hypothetical protein M1812_005635 [Candelaria pacifica]|nr:MAG: hypothetical protein M1812_005635 [Candelaria pacifica]